MLSLASSNPFGMPSLVRSNVAVANAAPSSRPINVPSAAEPKWDSRFAGPIPHTTDYYMKCMLGGILSCGLTHTAVTPLDVAKCNMQTDPGKYKGLLSSLRVISSEGGVANLVKGWAPTLIGYSMQGFFKFGFYEVFKDVYANMAGEENATKYRAIIWLAASASAEFFADIALCPMEMVKVKVQTSPTGAWPTSLGPALAMMSAKKVETRFPFGSLVPLWSRQIPYTMAKFALFQAVVETLYGNVFTQPKDSYSKSTQLGITFLSGYIAGVGCAIISHPADNLVSQIGKPANQGKSFGQIAGEIGMKNLMTAGLGTRIIMIGTLTGLQWYIYDSFKTVCGLGTTGGAVKK
jgi:solute carrier family 25 phosphate transporter 3